MLSAGAILFMMVCLCHVSVCRCVVLIGMECQVQPPACSCCQANTAHLYWYPLTLPLSILLTLPLSSPLSHCLFFNSFFTLPASHRLSHRVPQTASPLSLFIKPLTLFFHTACLALFFHTACLALFFHTACLTLPVSHCFFIPC